MIADIFLHLNLSWLLMGAVTGLSFYWLWTKTRRPYMMYNIPPFPVPPLPFVGHFFMMKPNLRDLFKDWREKAGDIFSLDIGGRHNIIVHGYDNIREVLVKNADHVPNTQLLFSPITNDEDKGIIGARDGNWKEQRTISLSILRHFGMGKNFLAEKIAEEVAVYIEKLADLKGRPYDFRMMTNMSVSNVICAIIVGKRFEHEDPYFQRFIHLTDELTKKFSRMVVLSAFPILRHLPGDFFHIKQVAEGSQELTDMFAKMHITQNKENFNANEDPGNFIAAYLQEMSRKKDQGKDTHLDEENLAVIIRTLFGAGTETTSTTMYWCVFYMLHNPEIQEKVYQEIKDNVGTDRVPSISDKPKLKYLNAVIMETQRMASLTPFGLRREVSSQFEVGGYTFPKGSVVWPNLDSVLYDKKIWGDPENFRPERFLDSNGALKKPEELIPFSMGRRICLGKGLAQMELFIFLSNMFQRFKFEVADAAGKPPSTEIVFGGTVLPRPYEVRFIERRQ